MNDDQMRLLVAGLSMAGSRAAEDERYGGKGTGIAIAGSAAFAKDCLADADALIAAATTEATIEPGKAGRVRERLTWALSWIYPSCSRDKMISGIARINEALSLLDDEGQEQDSPTSELPIEQQQRAYEAEAAALRKWIQELQAQLAAKDAEIERLGAQVAYPKETKAVVCQLDAADNLLAVGERICLSQDTLPSARLTVISTSLVEELKEKSTAYEKAKETNNAT